MSVWLMGKTNGQNWLSLERGPGSLPMIVWKDGEPPERYRHLAKQAREMAAQDAELAQRYARQREMHERQAEAFQAIAEVLETGTTTTVTIVPLERPILPEGGDGERGEM